MSIHGQFFRWLEMGGNVKIILMTDREIIDIEPNLGTVLHYLIVLFLLSPIRGNPLNHKSLYVT